MTEYTDGLLFIGKEVTVIVDRPLGSVHPKHSHIIYGVNYGYVPDTLSPDGEELDAYILGVTDPLERFKGFCHALLRRKQDNDDKLIVVPKGMSFTELEIRKAISFQEKFFESDLIF